MEATYFSSFTNPCRPLFPKSWSRKRSINNIIVATSRDYEGKLVDENMIVLRMRIKKMKMQELKDEPPLHWMEWEKQYYEHYAEDVCEAIGFLQSYFMNIRPCLALGMAALVTMSVPISLGAVLFYALEIANAILYGFH